jgi:hypothetical protein
MENFLRQCNTHINDEKIAFMKKAMARYRLVHDEIRAFVVTLPEDLMKP